MQRYLKFPTRLTVARTGRFCHPTQGSNKAPTTLAYSRAFKKVHKDPAAMFPYCAAFKKAEALWLERIQGEGAVLRKILDEHRSEWVKHLAEKEARMLNRFEGYVKILNQQRAMLLDYFNEWQQKHKKQAENLVVQNCDLLNAALGERTERMKLEGKYNIHGALERIVYLAKLQKKISSAGGIQQGLSELAQSDEFTAILSQEVQARKLDATDVMACVGHLYEAASNYTKGNDNTSNDTIIVRTTKFNDNELAALVVFLRIQSNWQSPVAWKEHDMM